MKTAISIPDPVFKKADKLAKRIGVSRSELYARAVETFINSYDSDHVRSALNALYDSQPSELDPVLSSLQNLALTKEEW